MDAMTGMFLIGRLCVLELAKASYFRVRDRVQLVIVTNDGYVSMEERAFWNLKRLLPYRDRVPQVTG